MNYTELVSVLQDYLQDEEDSFLDNIDNFIQLAEKRIYMSLRLPVQRQQNTGSIVSGNKFLPVPSTCLAVISLEYTDGSGFGINLLRKEQQFIREAYPDPTATGAPVYYAVYDHDSLLLGPTPDANYSALITFDGFPASIVTDGNNWLGDNLERLLLYGTLVEGYIYMKGDADLLDVYQNQFAEELQKASLKNVGMAYGTDETKRGAAGG